MRPVRPIVLVAGAVVLVCLFYCSDGGPGCWSGMASLVGLGGSIGGWAPSLPLTASIVTGVVVALLASTVVQMRRHHRLARSFEDAAQTTWLSGHEVRLVPGLTSPCVAGLARSRIYCPPDLAVRLRADELRAVILHERHHQLAHAPARLVLLAALQPVLVRVPGGWAWLERRRASLEIAADDHAIRNGAHRPSLARALIKLSPERPGLRLAGYASASELRLRHLTGEASAGHRSLGSAAVLAVPVIALIACQVRGLLG